MDNQLHRCMVAHQNTSIMHNLKTNSDKFFNITKSVFKIVLTIFFITLTDLNCLILRILL